MINSIELLGFKSFLKEKLYLNRLTILSGLNSSGKSSVIQAIRILSNVTQDKEDFLLEGHGDISELKNSYTDEDIFIGSYDEKEELIASIKMGESKRININTTEFPKIIYIAAERYGPQNSIPMSNNIELGTRGENVLHCINEYAERELSPILRNEFSEGDTFLFDLRGWLCVISPGVKFEYSLQQKSDSSYSLFNNFRSSNVGFGLSYTLPVITALLMGSITDNSIVLIENPEAHLHPRGQTEMGKLIALCVQAGAQVVVETHSDHLFDGIRLFAKQNKDFADKVNTYWFELDSQGNTSVEFAKLDDNGRIDNWPDGMFDQFEINASELI